MATTKKPKPTAKPAAKSGTKSGTKAGTKSGTKVAAKTSTKAAAKFGTRAGTKSGTKIGSKPKPRPRKKAGQKTGKKAGKSGKGLGLWLPVLAVGALVVLIGGYLASEFYLKVVTDRVEAVVGELDARGVKLQMGTEGAAVDLLDQLRSVERSSFGDLEIAAVRGGYSKLSLDIILGGDRFPLELRWSNDAGAPPGDPNPLLMDGHPRLALVIDDLGVDYEIAQKFLDQPFPVTLAILPHLRHSTRIARLAISKGAPHLLHMPMEPKSYPTNDPGEGAIMASDTQDEVVEDLARALISVPRASGVNNHMGSCATEEEELMGWVMAELSRRDIFFLDSLTSPKSVAGRKAREAGLRWATRQVFIDNVLEAEMIDAQLQSAVEIALKSGAAIAIGHPHAETIEAIERWRDQFAQRGVEVVWLTELLHK